MSKQRISFMIQQVPDEAYLINFLKQLKPTSIGVIDNPALLLNILNAVPEIEIGWHRFTEKGEAELWTDNQNYIDLVNDFKKAGLHNHPRAWLYVMNEPKAHGASLNKMCDWMVRAMTHARNAGVKCVMGNLGAAVYEKHEIDSGAFDEWLRKLHEWRDTMIAGFHEYGPPILPMGAAGRTTNDAYHLDPAMAQQVNWPSPWDVQVPNNMKGSMNSNYFIGRIYWWDERSNHIGVKPARKLITEAGPDRLDIGTIYQQLEKKYSPAPYQALRGINTCRRLWEAYYPQWGFDRTALEMFKWLAWVYDDTLYRNQKVSSVEGVNLFTWTSPNKPEWGKDYGFDYSELRGLHQLMSGWTAELLNTAPPIPAPQPPSPPSGETPPVPTPQPPAPPSDEINPALVKAFEAAMTRSYLLVRRDLLLAELAKVNSLLAEGEGVG